MSDLQKDLFRYFNAVIYTDCDELIVPDPRRFTGLRDYIETMQADCARPVGLDIFQARTCEAPLNEDRVLSEQRSYCWFKSTLCKPLVTRAPVQWLPGFHACDKRTPIDPSLFLFHTKNADFAGALRRLEVTRNLEWSEQSLKGTWGLHQRRPDEQWIKEAFDAPEAILRRGAQTEFHFDELIADFFEKMEFVNKIWHCPHFNGPVFRIPEWLRGTF